MSDEYIQRRHILFKRNKPNIRPFAPGDLAWLWAAYKHGSFDQYGLPEMDQGMFASFIMENIVPRYHDVEIIEDENNAFRSGKGPLALVTTFYDGWRLEPHVDWFKWSTPRDILRGTVAYLQRARYRKDVGVVVIRSLKNTKNLFDRAETYGVIHYRGKIPYGDERGDDYLFSSRGNLRKIA